MSQSKFIYVSYIRAARDQVWRTLVDRESMRKCGLDMQSDWRAGASWNAVAADGGTSDTGEVLEFDPPRRLALNWRHQYRPELAQEGFSRCVVELDSCVEPKRASEYACERQGNAVRLTITHTIDLAESKLIEGVSAGWPPIICNLKSLIETGETVLA